MSDYKCTQVEREFLDAIKRFVNSPEQAECPFCSYDGLGPQTPRIATAFKALAAEQGASRHE